MVLDGDKMLEQAPSPEKRRMLEGGTGGPKLGPPDSCGGEKNAGWGLSEKLESEDN